MKDNACFNVLLVFVIALIIVLLMPRLPGIIQQITDFLQSLRF